MPTATFSAGVVGIERLEAHGDVVTAGGVVRKGALPQAHVAGARRVEEKGIITYRGVETGRVLNLSA